MLNEDLKSQYRIVGTRPDRPDGLDKVTGRARYGADFSLPGMLWGAVVRSPHAHARIKSIDASAALALEGVKAVITRADLPTGLTGEDWNLQENTLAGDVALYDGHAIAAVAATSPLLAQDAARLIRVDYEPLPMSSMSMTRSTGCPCDPRGFGRPYGSRRNAAERRWLYGIRSRRYRGGLRGG